MQIKIIKKTQKIIIYKKTHLTNTSSQHQINQDGIIKRSSTRHTNWHILRLT